MQVDSTTHGPRIEVDLAGLAPAEFSEHQGKTHEPRPPRPRPDPAGNGWLLDTHRHLVIARATADVSRTQSTAHASGATVHEAAENAMNALRRELVSNRPCRHTMR